MTGINNENRHLPLPDAPYRGIQYFRYIDQDIFFARKVEIKKLHRLVTMYRGVLLYGGSGVGKSSLVNSGFIPDALQENFTAEKIRLLPLMGSEIVIERIATTVADEKKTYLPSIFTEDEDPYEHVVLSLEAFMEKIREALKAKKRPLLIFDQFEEFITQFEEAPAVLDPKKTAKIQENILNTLVRLLRDQTLAVKLLFVFREDYLAKLSMLFKKEPNLQDQYLRLKPIQKEHLQKIIRGPFENPELKKHFKKEISQELTQKIIRQIEEQRAGEYLNLTEIQIVCLKLWQAKNPQRLFSEKGVKGLLEAYFDDALAILSEDLYDPAILLLTRLVTVSGLRILVPKEDLINGVKNELKLDAKPVANALKSLEEDAKLVRRELRKDVTYYEIVSEFLAPMIRRKKEEHLLALERRTQRRKRYKIMAISIAVVLAISAFLIIKIIHTNKDTEVRKARFDRDTAIIETRAKIDELKGVNNIKNALEEKLAQVEADKKKMEEDLSTCNVKVTGLIKEKNQFKEKWEKVSKEKKGVEDKLHSAVEVIKNLIEKWLTAEEKKKNAINELNKEIKERNKRVIEQVNQEIKKKIEELENQKNSEIKNLENKIKNNQDELERIVTVVEEGIAYINNQRDKMDKDIKREEEKFKKESSKLKKMKRKINGLQAERDYLRAISKCSSDTLKKIGSRIDKINETIKKKK